jgi:hypothetical protein
MRAKVAKVTALNNDARIKANTILQTDPNTWTTEQYDLIKRTFTDFPEVQDQTNPTNPETIVEKTEQKTNDNTLGTTNVASETK